MSKNQISQVKRLRLEHGLGLESGSLKKGFRVTEVHDILGKAPRSPLTGNRYFWGGGQGLPNWAPELIINSVPAK